MGDLGEDVEAALARMTKTVDELPGAFRAEFSLEYWAGVVPRLRRGPASSKQTSKVTTARPSLFWGGLLRKR